MNFRRLGRMAFSKRFRGILRVNLSGVDKFAEGFTPSKRRLTVESPLLPVRRASLPMS